MDKTLKTGMCVIFPLLTSWFTCVWSRVEYIVIGVLFTYLWHGCLPGHNIMNMYTCEFALVVLISRLWILTYSYLHVLPSDKSPYTSRNVKRAKWQHKQRHKKDYTAVADRLRTVSWSNYGHPTGVVNLVYGPNLPTPRNSHVKKDTRLKICK